MSMTLPRNAFASTGAELIQPVAPSSEGMGRAEDIETFGADAAGVWPLPLHDTLNSAMATPATMEINNAMVVFTAATQQSLENDVNYTKVSVVRSATLA